MWLCINLHGANSYYRLGVGKTLTYLQVLHPVLTWYPPALGLFATIISVIDASDSGKFGLVSRISSYCILPESLRKGELQ